jgi:hypothetical protein
MYMRQALDDLLCSRYPDLYADRHLDASRSAMAWGFPGDGWFAIIDTLSAELTRAAEVDGSATEPAKQVKEKFGTLRFYVSTSQRGSGAIDMAEEMSSRLCENTGHPGRLGHRGGLLLTRAPGVVEGSVSVDVGEKDKAGRMTVPPLGFSAADMLAWRAGVLDGPVDIPDGWLDLVDGMLRQLSHGSHVVVPETVSISIGRRDSNADDGAAPVVVSRIYASNGVMRVNYMGGGPYTDGVVAMAIGLSLLIDPETGIAGPVGDNGRFRA